MARPLRIEFPGAVYHITSRGNARQEIFLDEKDFISFLDLLCFVVKRYNWILYAYCLMNNHYHLLLETKEGNLSRGMRQLNGIYTQRFNRRYNRVGHLFQGRYKAVLVDKENYLLELCRYIVLNPVRTGIVDDPKRWKWSSFRATAGFGSGIPCLTKDWILLQFGKERKKAEELFKEFVYAGLKTESPWKELKGQIYLGGEKFIERIKDLIKEKEELKEIPREQRYIAKPSLEEMFKEREEEEAVYEAHVKYGYTLREIAEYLDVHYTTVSRTVKRMEAKKEK